MSLHHPDDFGADPSAPLKDLPGHSSRGRLERVLRRGEFAVTAELNPPDSADPEDVYERIKVFEGWVDAVNATDGSGAHCHMSSVAISALLTRVGFSCVLQISCRDYNRIAIQGNVLGAAALGVANVLCLSGDGVQCGDHPEAKPVFDMDSTSLLSTVRMMREEKRFLSGRKITTPPRMFIGAAENPFAPPYDFRPQRLAKKVAAGAQFIQTQYCFDVPILERFMARVRDMGLHEKVFILVGVGPIASARTARWMRTNVAGVHIPDAMIARLEGAENQKEEGKKICIEQIQQIREIKGVSGVHMMAYKQEETVAEIVHHSGVLKGRTPWRRDLVPTTQSVESLD
ncbi:methylenetetrahydrofolate reductase [Methylovirgula sp. 4M-Z18]|uniref:methylenetetrahydrofolate reductase n=1 Tax=Methylovirgula sp. 4M-Z18 TaxID=2293567 RepID=UPI000E2FC9D3|nr:methylenetetrahydrofolate reductase [Methylovirgula sp. 4M-Z18]RFB79246.1 methylenetetrahydrofolate reductase [Methylovirgula sp. 4M-Z18]